MLVSTQHTNERYPICIDSPLGSFWEVSNSVVFDTSEVALVGESNVRVASEHIREAVLV